MTRKARYADMGRDSSFHRLSFIHAMRAFERGLTPMSASKQGLRTAIKIYTVRERKHVFPVLAAGSTSDMRNSRDFNIPTEEKGISPTTTQTTSCNDPCNSAAHGKRDPIHTVRATVVLEKAIHRSLVTDEGVEVEKDEEEA